MHVPFESLPGNARIWIYQSAQKITKESRIIISDRLHAFTERWEAHGHPLTASYTLKHDHFVIIAVDENVNGASGCSIDGCVRVIQEIQVATGINLFDRTTAFFMKEEVFTLPLKELSAAYQKKLWQENTMAFDSTVKTKEELGLWLKPASQTWLNRYITKVTS